MLRDIRNGIDGSLPGDLTTLGNQVYFTANDGLIRTELWSTDGTAPGTQCVADIRLGADGSNPRQITPGLFSIWLTADDGTNGIELWRSDGGPIGTQMVANIASGAEDSSPLQLTRIQPDELLFTADDGVTGREFWHATASSATLLELKMGECGSRITGLSNLGPFGLPLFSAESDDDTGLELWTSDGTQGGTVRLEDINTAPNQPAQDIAHRLRSGQPIIDTTFKVSGFTPGSFAVLLFGLNSIAGIPLNVIFPGFQGDLNLDPVGIVFNAPLVVDAQGNASFVLPFPSTGAGLGEIFTQALEFTLPGGASTNNASTCVGEIALPCGTLEDVEGHYVDDNFDYCFFVNKPFVDEVWMRLVKTRDVEQDEEFLQLTELKQGKNAFQITRKLGDDEAIEARFYCDKPDDDQGAFFVACTLGC